jgi:hypothetical protein
MSGLGRICPAWRPDMFGIGRICPVSRNFAQRKGRSEAKTMRQDSDKLAISWLDNIELGQIMRATRRNQNYRNQT